MTGEVLSNGRDPDRPPAQARLPRRLRWAGLVLVPLVAVGLVVRGVGTREAARGPTPSPSSFGPSATATSVPPPAAALPHLVGPQGTAPAGLAMLISGRGAGVFNPVTGLVTAIAGLPATPGNDVTIVRSGDTQAAVVSGTDATSSTDDSTLYVHAAGRAGFRPAGHPGFVLPAPAGGLYVMSRTDPQTIEERDAAFRLRWRRPLRRGEIPLTSTRHGLAAAYEPGVGVAPELRLISARSGRVLRHLGTVASSTVVSDGDRLGYVPAPCPGRCVLRMLDLRTGRASDHSLPADRAFGSGSFSPDGRLLALSYYGEPAEQFSGRRPHRGFVATCDIATGRWSRVPGVDTPVKQAADVGWAADGRLVLSVRFPGQLRFAVWRPGDRQLSVLPGSVETAPESYLSAAVLS